MRDLLSRGVGVHHGGLLPIVKEVSGPDLRKADFSLVSPDDNVSETIFAPLRFSDGRNIVSARSGQGLVCDRDVCYGAYRALLNLLS